MCKSVREAYSRALAGKLKDVMGVAEFWHLGTLVTDPEHERKGAGRMLVEWGCRRADAEGRKCSLHATPGAKKLYAACGFEVVSETEVDMRAYGGDAVVVATTMVRMPGCGSMDELEKSDDCGVGATG